MSACTCDSCNPSVKCPCDWYGIDLDAAATWFGDGEKCSVSHAEGFNDGCSITATVATEERAAQLADQWRADGQLERVSYDGCPADENGPAEWYVYGSVDRPKEWATEEDRAELANDLANDFARERREEDERLGSERWAADMGLD